MSQIVGWWPAVSVLVSLLLVVEVAAAQPNPNPYPLPKPPKTTADAVAILKAQCKQFPMMPSCSGLGLAPTVQVKIHEAVTTKDTVCSFDMSGSGLGSYTNEVGNRFGKLDAMNLDYHFTCITTDSSGRNCQTEVTVAHGGKTALIVGDPTNGGAGDTRVGWGGAGNPQLTTTPVGCNPQIPLVWGFAKADMGPVKKSFACATPLCLAPVPQGSTIEFHHHGGAPLRQSPPAGSPPGTLGPAAAGVNISVDVDIVANFGGDDCSHATVKIVPDLPSNDGLTPGADKSFVSTDKLTLSSGTGCPVQWAAKGVNADHDGNLDPATATVQPYLSHAQPLLTWWSGVVYSGFSDSQALSYNVTAKQTSGTSQDKITLLQDEIDQIREQYIEVPVTPPAGIARTPARQDLINSTPAACQHYSWGQIQSKDQAPWALFSVCAQLEAWRLACINRFHCSVTIGPANRAYTTPMWNFWGVYNADMTKSAAFTSPHMWGIAVDAAANATTYTALRNAAKDVNACVEPWAMVKTHPHAHADWRSHACGTGW